MKIPEYLKLGLVAIIFAILSASLIMSVKNDLEGQHQPFLEMVGKRIVIDSDTSTILDYSLLENTFTLSNGKEISTVLATPDRIIK